jgi:hypothetical protein
MMTIVGVGSAEDAPVETIKEMIRTNGIKMYFSFTIFPFLVALQHPCYAKD